ncbi:unnamed protein product, partial [Arabidopsis halleri]
VSAPARITLVVKSSLSHQRVVNGSENTPESPAFVSCISTTRSIEDFYSPFGSSMCFPLPIAGNFLTGGEIFSDDLAVAKPASLFSPCQTLFLSWAAANFLCVGFGPITKLIV